MADEPLFGLSCAGGGAHGAYQVGALKYIHKHFARDGRSPFKIFTGASCGALNTTFYAAESYDAAKACETLEELWLGFHVPLYHGNILKNAFWAWLRNSRKSPEERKHTWSLLDPTPMQKIIEKGLQRSHLMKALESGSTQGVAIAATELISGRTCWFQEGKNAKTWNLFHSIGMQDRIRPIHLEASCSVPIFLPPVKIGQYFFLDGSISLSKPLIAAMSMGATKILSIATEQFNSLDLPNYRNDFQPKVSHVVRLLLNRLSHDAAGDEIKEIETYNRFHQGLSRKNQEAEESLPPLFHEDSKPGHYQKTEIFQLIPSTQIRSAAGEERRSRRRTRFMFHESFIRELMHMGYADAEKKHEELKQFFESSSGRKRWFFFRSPHAA